MRHPLRPVPRTYFGEMYMYEYTDNVTGDNAMTSATPTAGPATAEAPPPLDANERHACASDRPASNGLLCQANDAEPDGDADAGHHSAN